MGLNVGNRQPTTCLDALLEETNEQAPCLSRDELLAVVMGKFEELFNLFSTQGELKCIILSTSWFSSYTGPCYCLNPQDWVCVFTRDK